MSIKKAILYTFIASFIIYILDQCKAGKTDTVASTDTVGTGVTSSDLTITKSLTTAQLTTQVNNINTTLSNQVNTNKANDTKFANLNASITTLTNQLNTANLSDATRDKQLTSQSLLIGTLQASNKALTDTLNAYKRIADGNVFEIKNGVWTVQRYQEIIAAMIKAGLLK